MRRWSGAPTSASHGLGARPAASLGLAIGPETGLHSRAARSGLRPRGWDASGVVARSEVDAWPAVVEVRPGGMPPAGQGHRDQRADIDRQAFAGPGPAVPKGPGGG